MGNPNPVGNPKGRPKGSPNKATADVRAVIAKFVNGTHGEALALWRDLAKSANNADKARAIELWARIAQFVCPRPVEVSGPDGEQIAVSIAINGIVRDREAKDLEPAADPGAVPRV